jgi:hypothetical protein
MSTSSNNKWLVALVDDSFSQATAQRAPPPKIVELNDPATQDPRNYVIVQKENQTDIVEIQILPSSFSSFLIGRHVVADGNLYVLTHMDPMFWVLAANSPETTQKRSWQPYEQIISSLPDSVQKAVVEEQLGHCFQTLCNDQTDNVCFFKFSEEKAIRWLKRKQEKLYQCFLKQDQVNTQRQQKELNTKGGSVSATFYMPADPMAAATTNNIPDESGNEQFKIESLQVICNYLSPEWSKKFCETMKLTEEKVLQVPNTKSPKINIVPVSQEEPEAPKAKKKVEDSRTAANKRLSKTNIKGMKTMGSFFGGPASKKGKTQ